MSYLTLSQNRLIHTRRNATRERSNLVRSHSEECSTFVFGSPSSHVQMRVFVNSVRKSDGTCRYSSSSIGSYAHTNLSRPHLSNNFVRRPTKLLFVVEFLTFSVLVANPKNLLYTVTNPARGLLNNREKRTKEKVWQHTPPHPK